MITAETYEGGKAPARYEKGRRCSMGYDHCLTAEDCKEVGKIRETKPAKGVAWDGSEIHLCNLCEGAWARSGKTIFKFTGLRRRKRIETCELPNLNTIRNLRGLSQYALSDKAGVDRNYIQKIELDKLEANVKQAGKLAQALGVSIDELRGSE